MDGSTLSGWIYVPYHFKHKESDAVDTARIISRFRKPESLTAANCVIAREYHISIYKYALYFYLSCNIYSSMPEML